MIDTSINLVLRNLRGLLTIAAVIAIPVAAIVLVLDLIAFQEADVFADGVALYEVGNTVRPLDESRLLILQVIGWVIGGIAYVLIIGATFRAVSEAYLGREPDPRASLGAGGRRVGSLLWITVLMIIGLVIPFLLVVLPGIWLLIAWSVVVPALMVEDARGTKALRRSFRLVRKHWWRTFGALLVGFIFVALLTFLISLLGVAFDGLADSSVFLFLAALNALGAISTIVTAPLYAAIVTVIYYDLRVRKEGFDVQLLADRIDSGAAVPEPSVGAPTPDPGSAVTSPPVDPSPPSSAPPPPSQPPPTSG